MELGLSRSPHAECWARRWLSVRSSRRVPGRNRRRLRHLPNLLPRHDLRRAIGFGAEALRRNAWFESVNPFGDLGERYVGHTLGWLVSLAIVVDLLSVLIAFTLAASRLLMALAREGCCRARADLAALPLPRGRANRAHCMGAARDAVGGAHPLRRLGRLPNVLQAILILSATGSYLITLVYLLLAGGALSLLWSDRPRGGLWWRLPVALAGRGPDPVLRRRAEPVPEAPNDRGVYFACAGLGLALLWSAALRLLRPDALRARAELGSELAAIADLERGNPSRTAWPTRSQSVGSMWGVRPDVRADLLTDARRHASVPARCLGDCCACARRGRRPVASRSGWRGGCVRRRVAAR
jgi:hypothetical protein